VPKDDDERIILKLMLKKQDVREGSGFIVAHATISNFDTL
jgi:hypothetical protein